MKRPEGPDDVCLCRGHTSANARLEGRHVVSPRAAGRSDVGQGFVDWAEDRFTFFHGVGLDNFFGLCRHFLLKLAARASVGAGLRQCDRGDEPDEWRADDV